jgi:hypothetical protein
MGGMWAGSGGGMRRGLALRNVRKGRINKQIFKVGVERPFSYIWRT